MSSDKFKQFFEVLRKKNSVEIFESTEQFFLHKSYFLQKLYVKKNVIIMNRKFKVVADPFKIVYLDADMIKKYLRDRSWESRWEVWGRIENGEWDNKNTIPIDEYAYYKAFKRHFIDGLPWEKTGIAEHLVSKRKKRDDLPYKGMETWEEVRQYYLKKYTNGQYDELYQNIQQNGFQAIPRPGPHPCDYYVPYIIIGRNGEFIFRGNGHHRIAIAKLLGLKKIPAYVYLRHNEWQEIREEVYKNGFPKKFKHLRYHPDLQDILN